MRFYSLAAMVADRTLFLITDQKLRLAPSVAMAVLLILIVALFFVARRVPRAFWRRSAFVLLSIAAAIALIRTLVLAAGALPFAFNLQELNSAVQAYQRGDYVVAEGVVSKYQISSDKRQSCFFVGDTRICTNMAAGPVGYHRTGATVPLEDGMHVKVFYHAPIILRIDLLE